MAKNLGREYAAMTEDERREFELKRRAKAGDGARSGDTRNEELDLDDPRSYPEDDLGREG